MKTLKDSILTEVQKQYGDKLYPNEVLVFELGTEGWYEIYGPEDSEYEQYKDLKPWRAELTKNQFGEKCFAMKLGKF